MPIYKNNAGMLQYVRSAIETLYRDTDIAPPTPEHPITPLGALLTRLSVVNEEMANLSRDRAAQFLSDLGVLPESTSLGANGGSALAGLLFATGTVGVIFSELHDPVTRRRFSVAHELAHFRLHYSSRALEVDMDGEMPTPFVDGVTNAQVDAAVGGVEEHDETLSTLTPLTTAAKSSDDMEQDEQREVEADVFAAELLIPSNVVMTLAKTYMERFPLDAEDLSQRLAEDMLVSKAAMRRRVAALGLTVTTGQTEVIPQP